MKLNEYQTAAEGTATWMDPSRRTGVGTPGGVPGIVYCALGLTGESGEVADDLKKAYRNDGEVTLERRQKLIEELGDVLWYAALLATELNTTLEFVAEGNLAKLAKRKKKDELKVHS